MVHSKIHVNVISSEKPLEKPPKVGAKLTQIDKAVPKSVPCSENFNEYLQNTTLHGLKYVGDRSLSMFER